MFETAAIVGPGLIGGSMGLALRQRGLAERVVGIGRRQVSLDKALEAGAVDEATLEPAEGVAGAELVVLATPIGAFGALIEQLAPALRAGALLTDVASTKTEVVETITAGLRGRPDVFYVPTHPMAGSEQSGPEAARADLFEGAVCVITPLADTFPEHKARITELWRALGADVLSMTPQAHDRAVARTSHLPHLAAAALLEMLEEPDGPLCATGLIDTTRVASGKPEIWIDICATNREPVREALRSYGRLIERMAEALDEGNLGALEQILTEARDSRERLVRKRRERRTGR
jgi:prephenate dehydrogenase